MIQERHCFWGLAKEAGAQPAFLRLANGNAVLPTFFRHISFRARGGIGGAERLPFGKARSAASRPQARTRFAGWALVARRFVLIAEVLAL